MHDLNSLQQGNLGLATAIAFCAGRGYTVCIPLTDTQRYDLVAEIDGRLVKIQVKTSFKQDGEVWTVQLRNVSIRKTMATVVRKFDTNEVDYLFVLTGDGSRYFIPSTDMTARSELTIRPSVYLKYKV